MTDFPKPLKPVFTPSISFGNMVSMATVIVTVTGSFLLTRQTANLNAEDIDKLEVAKAAIEVRLTALEIGKAADDQKFANILSLLDRIDGRLERMERDQK